MPSIRLGAFTKRMAAVFHKRKANKLKEPFSPVCLVPLVPEPLPHTVRHELPQLIFDADLELSMWEDADRNVGLKSSSDSGDALSMLIDAHSDSDLGSTDMPSSVSVLADILDSFPSVPPLSLAPMPPNPVSVINPVASINTDSSVNIIADGFTSNGKIVHVNRTATSRRNVSIGIGSKRNAAASTSVFSLRLAR
jgi:hypothetical protein